MFSRVSVCLSEKDSVISKRKAKAVFTGKISDKERHPIPIFLFSSAKDRLGIEIWATLYGPVWLLPARQLAGQAAPSDPRPTKSDAWDCCLGQAALSGSEPNKLSPSSSNQCLDVLRIVNEIHFSELSKLCCIELLRRH